MLDRLKRRVHQVKERQRNQADTARLQAAKRQELSVQVQMLRALMADPRYEGYKRLIEEARQKELEILADTPERMDVVEEKDVGSVALTAERHRGRIDAYTYILLAPDILLDLANQVTTGGNGSPGLAERRVSA